jgi:peptidyl-prolyl cis-trans isomerase SurA
MLGLLFSLVVGHAADLVDGVACVVNDDVITLSELYGEVGPQLEGAVRERCRTGLSDRTPCVRQIERQAAEILIMAALVRQKLQENGFDVTDQQLEGYLDMFQAENGLSSREQLKVALAAEGTDFDAFRETMRDQARMMTFQQAFLLSKVKVTDDELRDRYQRATRDQADEDTLEITYKAYTLPADAPDDAVARVAAGLTEALAAGGGGFDALGAVDGVTPVPMTSRYTPSQLVEAFKPVAGLAPGQVAGPIRLGSSLFVFKMLSREKAGVVSFDEVRGRLEQQIQQEKLEEEGERWYQAAVRTASIRCTMDP